MVICQQVDMIDQIVSEVRVIGREREMKRRDGGDV